MGECALVRRRPPSKANQKKKYIDILLVTIQFCILVAFCAFVLYVVLSMLEWKENIKQWNAIALVYIDAISEGIIVPFFISR